MIRFSKKAKPCSNAPQRKNFRVQNFYTHYNLNNAQLVTNDPVTCQNNQANKTVDKPKEQTNHHQNNKLTSCNKLLQYTTVLKAMPQFT